MRGTFTEKLHPSKTAIFDCFEPVARFWRTKWVFSATKTGWASQEGLAEWFKICTLKDRHTLMPDIFFYDNTLWWLKLWVYTLTESSLRLSESESDCHSQNHKVRANYESHCSVQLYHPSMVSYLVNCESLHHVSHRLHPIHNALAVKYIYVIYI